MTIIDPLKPNPLFIKSALSQALFFSFFLFSSNASLANTYTVTNTNDAGSGSLRQAVLTANANAGDDTIIFSPSLAFAKITLNSGEISIGSNTSDDALTITGPVANNANSLVINANNNSRIFKVESLTTDFGLLTLNNLTLTGGRLLQFGQGNGGAISTNNAQLLFNHCVLFKNGTNALNQSGGAIYAQLSTVTLNHSLVAKNSTLATNGKGGGIYASTVILNHSTVVDNYTAGYTSSGGGIDAFNVTLNYSSVIDNHTAGDYSNGGGINAGFVHLNQSTVSGNSISGNDANGGGINAYKGITFKQSTISGNSTSQILNNIGKGGGVYLHGIVASTSLIEETTITNNHSASGGAGIHANATFVYSLNMNNSILSGNSGSQGNYDESLHLASSAVILNLDHSLFGDDANEITGVNIASFTQALANLAPLQINGGTTRTHLPNINSLAINAGNNATLTTSYDQRGTGYPRIHNATVDMGSVERSTANTASINEVLKRNEMAMALLQAKNISPALFATGLEYYDVQANNPYAIWIEAFKQQGFTEGCSANKFCPDSVVTRASLAKIFLKVKYGPAFTPNSPSQLFNDVSLGDFNAAWINALSDNVAFTVGCDTHQFCPRQVVTREWFNTLLNQLP